MNGKSPDRGFCVHGEGDTVCQLAERNLGRTVLRASKCCSRLQMGLKPSVAHDGTYGAEKHRLYRCGGGRGGHDVASYADRAGDRASDPKMERQQLDYGNDSRRFTCSVLKF